MINQVTSAVYTYNAADLGKTGSIYLFAYLDPNSPLLANSAAHRPSEPPPSGETRFAAQSATSNGLVLAVLSSTGWKQAASNAILDPLYTGTLSGSDNIFALYNVGQFKPTQDAGIICAAYTTVTGISAKSQGIPLILGQDTSARCPEVTLPAPSYQGLWWNPGESGWGMSLTQHGSIAFNALYTYDALGQPVWYVMSSCPISANGCTGGLYRVSGGTAPTVPWAGAVTVNPVGSGNLSFSDAERATFNFTLNGVSGSKALVRQTFASGSTPPPVDYTGQSAAKVAPNLISSACKPACVSNRASTSWPTLSRQK